MAALEAAGGHDRAAAELEQYSVENGGMAPGIKNPLGARALYIFQNNQDTLYRLHGSPDWRSIGKATSSGCVRLINQDVLDLYRRCRITRRSLCISRRWGSELAEAPFRRVAGRKRLISGVVARLQRVSRSWFPHIRRRTQNGFSKQCLEEL